VRRAPCIAIATLLAVSLVDQARAWGPVGHRAIGQIASRQLSDEVRREVLDILGGASLAEASTWMDDVRSEPRYDWLEPLHYVNLDPRRGRFQGCPPRGCIVDALRDARTKVGNHALPRAERREALRILIHLVGDLHQPLHVSHRADRGGNDVGVDWFGQRSNLHWVWDTGLLRDRGRWQQLADRLEGSLRDARLAREAASWRRGDVVDWTHESYRLTLEVVYPSAAAGSKLGRSYVERYAPVAERQLLVAGVRLAAVLDAALR
jgi:hypothetical protein